MSEVTYYYNQRSTAWDTDPDYMVDGILTNYASTDSNGDIEFLFGTTCPGTDLGTITKVEIRCYGYGDGNDRIDLFFAGGGVDDYQLTMPSTANWSSYADVTADPQVDGWTWANIANPVKGLNVELDVVAKGNTMHCAKVEIRVTYTPSGGPTPNAYNQILYTEEPPTPNAWNQVKQEASTGWKKLLYV